MDRNKAIEIIKSQCPVNKQLVDALEFLIPELKESEDERIRKQILSFLKEFEYDHYRMLNFRTWISWLEKQDESDETKAKIFLINRGYPIDANGIIPSYVELFDMIREGLEYQGQTFTKKDVDDAYLKGVCDAKQELEKQCESHAKDFGEFINSLSEQFQEVSFAKLSRIAVRVKKYLEQCNQSNAQSNGIWHTADVAPFGSSDKQILVLFTDYYAMVVPVEDWESLDKPLKWAFISDLFR